MTILRKNMVVYMVINCINGRKYIGRDSCNDKYYLGSGKLIQLAHKKYGRNNFIKIILRKCFSVQDLIKWEQYYLNLYDASNNKSFYNCTNNAEHGGKNYGINVYKYDFNGAYVMGYESVQSAARQHGVSSMAIHNASKGITKSSCGYFWSYEKKDKIIKDKPKLLVNKPLYVKKTVYYYNLHGKYLGSFPSIRKASLTLNVNMSSVNKSCSHLGQVSPSQEHNYLFSFFRFDVLNIIPSQDSHLKPIDQYNKNGEFIKSYNSLISASKENKISESAIGHALCGDTKMSGGFIWKYHKQDII